MYLNKETSYSTNFLVLAIPQASHSNTSSWDASSGRLRLQIEPAKQSIHAKFGETDLIAILIPAMPSPIPVALRAVSKEIYEDAWSNAVRMLRDMLAQRSILYLYPFSEVDGAVLTMLRYIFATTQVGARHVVYLDEKMPEVKDLEVQAGRLGIELRTIAVPTKRGTF